jgi:SAM-dependent methyltransferase
MVPAARLYDMAAHNAPEAYTAESYNKTASFVYSDAFTRPVLGLLNAQPRESILDLGCGSAELSIMLAQIVGREGLVVGVDASESMVCLDGLMCGVAAFISFLILCSRSGKLKPMG